MDIISTEQIKDTLSRSGYFLETRVLSVLHKNKYKNFPNETYPDSITGKSREMDIYSEFERITENLKLNDFLHFEFQHKLIIECINNLQPVVFFKRPDKNAYTIFGKFRYSKVEREIEYPEHGPGPDYEFHDFTTSSKKFHYNQLKSSTQYCSFTQKKTKEKDWMASHSDGLHDTFNKLFDFTSHKIKIFEEWLPKSVWKDGVFVILIFPVLILQNKLYEAIEKEGEVILEEKQHIIFEFNRYTDEAETLLIDVITENYLETYLDLVLKDMINIKETYLRLYENKKITAVNKV